MEQLILFAKDYWVALAVIFFVVGIVSVLVKSAIRLALIGLAIGAVLIYGFNYTPDEVVTMGKKVANSATAVVNDTIGPIVEKELKGAKTVVHPDGTYEIKTTSVTIVGKKGSETGKVFYKGKEYKVNISQLGSTVENYIGNIN